MRIRARIVQRAKWLCESCGSIAMKGEVDHITPLAKGGTDEDDNLQLLCLACHEKKTRIENGYRERRAIGLDGWPVEDGDRRGVSGKKK